MKIYAASRASVPERPAMWRKLRSDGHNIISTWIDEDGPGQSNMSELWPRIVEEIRSCDRLVMYVEESDLPLKGAFVEAGIALAFGKPVRIVAPELGTKSIGSWTYHHLVKYESTLKEALS